MRLYHRTIKLLQLPRHLLAGLCRSATSAASSSASPSSSTDADSPNSSATSRLPACLRLRPLRLNSTAKHLLHCALMLAAICAAEYSSGALKLDESARVLRELDPWLVYGFPATILLYALRALTLLTLPQVMFNFCGLVFYNAFPDKVVLKGSPLLAPFICIRVVTRGDFPDLVKANVLRNMNTCLDAGLEHFLVEVVTDRAIGMVPHRRWREVVVPADYRTRSGAMFKARALQYCLEDRVNVLQDGNWVVHLDEETLLTENSVRGIVNFVLDGKHAFGQGLITYASGEVVNWMTTLADSIRVSDDMGKVRFQFRAFHRPVFSWKGSYVVTQIAAERAVGFDNGPDGSVAEDCFFAMRAYGLGYTFDFIDGEMHEKSPFTLADFLQQRKRWLQGILLVVHSPLIAWRHKCFLAISVYSWCTMPLSSSNFVLAAAYPIPCPDWMDFACAFIAGVQLYLYVFGVLKSFSLHRFGVVRCALCAVGALCTIPVNIVIENVAVIWGMVGKKHKFYVVQKDVLQQKGRSGETAQLVAAAMVV